MTSKFSIEYPENDEFFLLKHLTLLSPETGLPHTETCSIMLTISEIPEVVRKLNEYANQNRNNRLQSTD
jgi:hypothetical protein